MPPEMQNPEAAVPTQPPQPPEAAAPPQPPEQHYALNQDALYDAWATMSVYDRTATHLKRNYIQRRQRVVGLALAATVFAVMAGAPGLPTILTLFAFLAFTLPIVGTYYLNDSVRFIGTTEWIKTRYTAEVMRMHIYLYRMRAGIYGPDAVHQDGQRRPADEMDDLFLEKINEAAVTINPEQGMPEPFNKPRSTEEIDEVIKRANYYTRDENGKHDTGIDEIPFDTYRRWRLESQQAWYEHAGQRDFARLKFFVRASQFFLLFGSLVSASAGLLNPQLVVVVAVTNAISAALILWSDVGLVGKTYTIFRIAKQKLNQERGRWVTRQNNADFMANKVKEQRVLVERVEAILEWERKEWYDMALQAQSLTDEQIQSSLTRLIERADDAVWRADETNQPPG